MKNIQQPYHHLFTSKQYREKIISHIEKNNAIYIRNSKKAQTSLELLNVMKDTNLKIHLSIKKIEEEKVQKSNQHINFNDSINHLFSKMDDNINNLVKINKDNNLYKNKFEQTFKNILCDLEKISSSWSSKMTEFDNHEKRSHRLIEQNKNQLSKIESNVHKSIEELNKHLSKGMLYLGNSISDLNQVLGKKQKYLGLYKC